MRVEGVPACRVVVAWHTMPLLQTVKRVHDAQWLVCEWRTGLHVPHVHPWPGIWEPAATGAVAVARDITLLRPPPSSNPCRCASSMSCGGEASVSLHDTACSRAQRGVGAGGASGKVQSCPAAALV